MSGSGTPGVNVHPDLIINNSIAMVVAATVFVSLRFYVRAVMIKSFGYDDWILLAAYFSFLVLSGLSLTYGVLVKANGLEQVLDQAILILIFRSFAYSIDMALVKIALAAFYFKVLPGYIWQRWTVVISTFLFTLFTLTMGFVIFFQCGNPLDVNSTNCLNPDHLIATSWVQAGLNAGMDWLLTLLPCTIVFRTQMSTRTKVSVISLLGLGALASVISVVRMLFLHTSNLTSALDSYTRIANLLVLSNWENCIGIVCISLAAMRPLLRRITKGSSAAAYYDSAESPSNNNNNNNKHVMGGPGRLAPIRFDQGPPRAQHLARKKRLTIETRFDVQQEKELEDIEMVTPPLHSPPDLVPRTLERSMV